MPGLHTGPDALLALPALTRPTGTAGPVPQPERSLLRSYMKVRWGFVARLGRWPVPPQSQRGFLRVRYGDSGIELAPCAWGGKRISGTAQTWLGPRWLPGDRVGEWCAASQEC